MRKFWMSAVLAGFGLSVSAATVFVEAEAFADKGGWVIDQQFMDQMGSPFLLAHGLGAPVAPANTTIQVPEAGDYRVWVRTRNWVEPWCKTEAPGRFQLCVNGTALPEKLGTSGAAWHWQAAGQVKLAAGSATLALQDLTGFDGRCDAIVLTTDSGELPNDVQALDALRRKVGAISSAEKTEKVDLVIAGAGVPGVCAAISAARLGLTVALIGDRPVLGGNNSSEVRVHLGGRINLGPYPRLGDVVAEIGPAKGGNAMPAGQYEDDRKLAVVQAEKNIRLFLSTRAIGVEMDGKKIKAVIARNIETGVETRFEAPLVLDNTGDGSIGALAGATFRYGRESKAETGEPTAVDAKDSQTMGSSVQWYSAVDKTATTIPFPDVAWGLKFTDQTVEKVTMGEWTWETGMNRHQIDDFEAVRDYGMLVVYSTWSYLKNHYKGKGFEKWANRRLEWVAYVAGKRESRRLLGDYVLTENDLMNRTPHPDGTACTTWTIDLHYPDPKNSAHFPGGEFKSIAKHHKIHAYPIPYRCLYSKDVDNLFMAGRNISVTHVALGTIRLIRTGGMMGEVVGMAAKICKDKGCAPRDIYTTHLDALKALMTKGVGLGNPQPPQKYNEGGMLKD